MTNETRNQVSLFSSLAVKKALNDVILTEFSKETRIQVEATFDPTNVLLQNIDDGARPDVLIAVSSSFETLGSAGVIGPATVTPLAKAGIGVAVAPGVDAPDISTREALTVALCSARSVAYSRTGASGVYFARLLEELNIAGEVNARATVVEKGFTALAVVDGRADLAIQQVSELLFVPEAQLVGPLPEAVQHYTEFSAALGSKATHIPPARALLTFLTGPLAQKANVNAGLEIA